MSHNKNGNLNLQQKLVMQAPFRVPIPDAVNLVSHGAAYYVQYNRLPSTESTRPSIAFQLRFCHSDTISVRLSRCIYQRG